MSVPIAEQADALRNKLDEKGETIEVIAVDATETALVPEPVKKVNGS